MFLTSRININWNKALLLARLNTVYPDIMTYKPNPVHL